MIGGLGFSFARKKEGQKRRKRGEKNYSNTL